MPQLEETRSRAEKGDAQAQYELGIIYCGGDGVKKDHREAAKWYRAAAEQGHAGGQNAMGRSYLNGEGVAQDLAEAIKWFRLAAAQGYADAQVCLGSICAVRGIPENYEEAKKWYGLAAAQGHEAAIWSMESIPDENEGPNVVSEELIVRECMECGRICSTNRWRKATTFRKENIHRENADSLGGSVETVKRIRSSDCGHCRPRKTEPWIEARIALKEKLKGKFFADDDCILAVRKDGSMVILKCGDRQIIICGSLKGLLGPWKKELTEEEFGEHIKLLRSGYESTFNDIRRSAGRFDWRSMIGSDAKEQIRISTGPAYEKEMRLLRKDAERDLIPFYECTYCRGQYFTEENARKCAASCREKRTADMKAHDPEIKDTAEDSVTIYWPWRCTYCRKEYGTEEEAKECAARCKEESVRYWGGRIIMTERASLKEIWVIKAGLHSPRRYDAIRFRAHPEHLHIYSDSYFDPMEKGDDLRELTEDEFLEQTEQIFAKGNSLLDDLSHSRGKYGWRQTAGSSCDPLKREEQNDNTGGGIDGHHGKIL